MPIQAIQAILSTLLNSKQYFIEDSIVQSSSITTKFSLSPERIEPIHINEKIDVEEWKRALMYDRPKIDELLSKILEDFEIEPTENNMKWLEKQVDGLLSKHETEYDLKLPTKTRSMLKNLMIRMA